MSDPSIMPAPRTAAFTTQTLKMKQPLAPKALAGLDLSFKEFRARAERAWVNAGLKVKLLELDDYEDEAFKVEVGSGGAIICALDSRGLLYGHHALLQMVAQCPREIPCCVIEDAPDTPLRAFQLDLRIHRYKPAYLQTVFADLARLRYNAVIVQYDDAFPFAKEPFLTGSVHYTADAVAEIGRYAADAGLMLIPSLAVTGSLGWIAGLERYSVFRAPGSASALDTANPKATRLLCALAEELMAAHAAPYFLLGTADADGRDPLAGEPVQASHIETLATFVAKRGKTPVVWADMACDAQLPKDTLLVARCADDSHHLAPLVAAARKDGYQAGAALSCRAATDDDFSRDTTEALRRMHDLAKGLKNERIAAMVVTSCTSAAADAPVSGALSVSLMRGGRRFHHAATWFAAAAAADLAWNRAGADVERLRAIWPHFWFGMADERLAELQFLHIGGVADPSQATTVIRDRKKVVKMARELKPPRHRDTLALLDLYARLTIHVLHARQIFRHTPTRQQAALLRAGSARLRSLHAAVLAPSLFRTEVAGEQDYYFGHAEMLLARLTRKK